VNLEDQQLSVQPSACLFVLSGPSGIGKTSLAKAMMKVDDSIGFVRSLTTRPPRAGSEDDYEYVSRREFQRLVDEDLFLEWIHPSFDEYYGMLRAPVDEALAQGRDLVFDWVPEGYLNLRRFYPEQTVGIFVMAPTVSAMRSRLSGRGSETGDELVLRQRMAEQDFDFVDQHEYHVINDDFDEALETIMAIRRAEKAKVRRQPSVLDSYRKIARKSLVRYYDPAGSVDTP
jgi:guanylate kinase